MNDDSLNSGMDKDPAMVALLRQSSALPPTGFAARTAAIFAAAVERRRFKRTAAATVAVFAVSSATLWMLLLNIQNAADSTWSGFKALLSFVGFMYTIWQRLPFTCGAITVLMLSVLVCTGGLLGKAYRSKVLVK